jgi:hypothetical protein
MKFEMRIPFVRILTAAFLLILFKLRHAQAQEPLNRESKSPRATIDASSLSQKQMMGYQGWFAAPGDGSQLNRWLHWFRSQGPNKTNLTVDLWPDVSELEADELFPTHLDCSNGAPARLFSSYNRKTVVRHFKWMADYGIDGVFLQRFSSELSNPALFDFRNRVAENVRAGAEAHGRVFSIMYDISGTPQQGLVSRLTNDWTFLTSALKITNSSRYLHHRGRPVVAIWGLGFSDRPGTPEEALQLIHFYKHAGLTVMGGVPSDWRTLRRDSKTNAAWAKVYRSFDIISPWSVGRYGRDSEADTFARDFIVPDLAETRKLGIDYLPVVFPGFSWHNLTGEKLNQFPRHGGKFYWRQVHNALQAGSTMLYCAMFDEVDEGTAVFKMATTSAELPAGTPLVPLNIDGFPLPSDWYLRLAGEATKMLRGEIPLSINFPASLRLPSK